MGHPFSWHLGVGHLCALEEETLFMTEKQLKDSELHLQVLQIQSYKRELQYHQVGLMSSLWWHLASSERDLCTW